MILKKIYSLFVFMLVLNQISFAQTYQWVKSNTHSIQLNPDFILFPSTKDASGNFIIGSIHNFVLGSGTSFYGDVIFRKYNTAGMLQTSKILTGKAVINGIETDAQGNIYVYGSFMDTLRIDAVNFIANTGSGFNLNDYVIKFSSSGNFIWKKNVNLTYGGSMHIGSMKVKGGSLFAGLLSSSFQGSVKKFDLNGNEQLSISQNPVMSLSAVDADGSGNIYAAGSCALGSIQFGNLNMNCPHNYSLYFVKYSSTGAGQWVRFVQDVTFERPQLVCDAGGNVYAAGELNGAFWFGNFQTQGPHWVYDFYLTKIDPSGTFLWVKEVPNNPGSPLGDAALGKSTCVELDNQNNVYVTGFQRGTINWGGFSTTNSGIMNVLVLKYNTNGTPLWGKTAGGPIVARGDAISIDNSGSILLSGNFSQTAIFDTITVNGSGQVNSFAAKISNPPVSVKKNKNISPNAFSLSNYPNPFNPVTYIRFAIPSNDRIRLTIYDMLGEEVAVLIDGDYKAGEYEIRWDAVSLPSGVYTYRLTAGGHSESRKMVLVK
jgi:hypothetical protein